MSQDALLLLLFKIALVADVAAVVIFTAVYWYLSRFWGNPVGRTLVMLDILLAFAVVPSLLSLLLHFNRLTSRVAAWVDVALFTLIAVALLARVPLWVKLHMNRQGEHTYAGMWPFLRQVIRRRGKPIWKDRPAPDSEGEE